jgi:LmeA-like phospholipid-binding
VIAPLGDLVSGELKGVEVREVEGQVKVKASDVTRALLENENPLISSITNLTIDPVSEQDARTDPEERTDEEQDAAERAEELESEDDTQAGTRLCASVNFAGEDTDLCAFGLITLVDAKANFVPSRVVLRNSVLDSTRLPEPQESALLDALTVSLDPGELPFTVTPTAVSVEPGVLSVKGKAWDVMLGGSGS